MHLAQASSAAMAAPGCSATRRVHPSAARYKLTRFSSHLNAEEHGACRAETGSARALASIADACIQSCILRHIAARCRNLSAQSPSGGTQHSPSRRGKRRKMGTPSSKRLRGESDQGRERERERARGRGRKCELQLSTSS